MSAFSTAAPRGARGSVLVEGNTIARVAYAPETIDAPARR
jgi:hypothetical protein